MQILIALATLALPRPAASSARLATLGNRRSRANDASRPARVRRLHPGAPRVGVGDLSLPHGGYFGPEVGGGIGHATHQHGLDVDVYYARLDRAERPPERPEQVDLALSQDLLDLFLEAGAVLVYTGPSLALSGPAEVVVPLVNHDNHRHVRLAP